MTPVCSFVEAGCSREDYLFVQGLNQTSPVLKLEDGVAEGSFGMHCAAMCGIANRVIERAEVAAREWEHTSRLKESLERAREGCYIPLGVLSDMAAILDQEKSGGILKASGDTKTDARLKLKACYYAGLLWAFWKQARNLDDRSMLTDRLRLKNNPAADLIVDDLLARFSETPRGQTK